LYITSNKAGTAAGLAETAKIEKQGSGASGAHHGGGGARKAGRETMKAHREQGGT